MSEPQNAKLTVLGQKRGFCQALNKTLVSATDVLAALQFVCVTFLEKGQSRTVISHRPAGPNGSALSTNAPNERSAVGGQEGRLC